MRQWKYEAYFNAISLEMFCKSCILFEKHKEYDGLNESEAKMAIEVIVKKAGHSLHKMLLGTSVIDSSKKQELLNANYDGYVVNQVVDILEAAYLEGRYPVCKPISRKLFPDYPLLSSGLSKFVRSFGREVLISLKADIDMQTIRSSIQAEISGTEQGERFCNLFFDGEIEKYL